MKREVDKRKTRKALRKLRRAAEAATAEDGPGLTSWEKDFVDGVTERLETYGSAFRDPAKGRLDEALSARQAQVTRVIAKKARKTKAAAGEPSAGDARPPRAGLQRKSGLRAKPKMGGGAGWKPRGRDIHDEVGETPASPASSTPSAPAASGPPALKLIRGGKPG